MDIVHISKQQYADHLKQLGPQDRNLRFLSCLNDHAIDQYVDHLGDCDELFGLINDHGVVAAIHVNWSNCAEFGLSVLENYRGQRLGSLLVSHLFDLCSRKNIESINCVCARQNRWMIAIAKKHQMTITFDYSECHAVKDCVSRPE